jgi:acyl-CoA thioesterase FadM
MKPHPHRRDEYFDYSTVTVTLHDMDIYGHLNTSLHRQYFDNAVDRYLSHRGDPAMRSSPVIQT